MKRGQALLEFLMTYGWAILVVLAAIAALAYFDVLSSDKFLPPKECVEPECTEANDMTVNFTTTVEPTYFLKNKSATSGPGGAYVTEKEYWRHCVDNRKQHTKVYQPSKYLTCEEALELVQTVDSWTYTIENYDEKYPQSVTVIEWPAECLHPEFLLEEQFEVHTRHFSRNDIFAYFVDVCMPQRTGGDSAVSS